MMMNNNSLKIVLGLCLSFALVVGESTDCKCRGPIKYYEELGCAPVFKNPGDCCPHRYNCNKLQDFPSDKCLINGHVYEIGEYLRDEDANPCDLDCICHMSERGPMFNCAEVDCPSIPQPGCYIKQNAADCCGFAVVCPQNDTERATCLVDGKTYRDGDYFEPAGEPYKSCYCGEGYTGENVEPFCYTPKNICGTMLRHALDIRDNCVPTYYAGQSPQAACSINFRCPNSKDIVISKATNELKSPESETTNSVSELTCTFGNLTMQIGDELGGSTDCMKCVCEVPPVPTCQELSKEDCSFGKR